MSADMFVSSQQITPIEHELQVRGLPSFSFAKPATLNGQIVIIRRGVEGYYPLPPEMNDFQEVTVDELNTSAGVTPLQAAAMFMGSMFGWNRETASIHSVNFRGKTEKQLKAVYGGCLL